MLQQFIDEANGEYAPADDGVTTPAVLRSESTESRQLQETRFSDSISVRSEASVKVQMDGNCWNCCRKKVANSGITNEDLTRMSGR